MPPELQWFYNKFESLNFGSKKMHWLTDLSIVDQQPTLIPGEWYVAPVAQRDLGYLNRLAELANSVEVGALIAVLGDWWQGQINALPTRDRFQRVYWYDFYKLYYSLRCSQTELYDQPKPTHGIQRMALLISNDAVHRHTFVAAAAAFDCQAIAIQVRDQLPASFIDTLIIDVDFHDHFYPRGRISESKPLAGPLVKRLCAAYPKAEIVLASNFPRWNLLEEYLQDEAVSVCGKPYDLAALLDVDARFSSAALPRK